MMIRRQRRARKGKELKICLGGSMAPWTFNVKFLYDNQFIFRSLMFTTREDANLELFTWVPLPSHPRLVYGKAPYYPVDPSTSSASGGAYSSLNPHAWPHYLCHDITRTPDQDTYLLALGWNIEFLIFGSIS
jgi:hypothetical protein